MKTFLVTVERTVTFVRQFEVQAEDKEEALEMVEEGDLDSASEYDEEVSEDYSVEEI